MPLLVPEQIYIDRDKLCDKERSFHFHDFIKRKKANNLKLTTTMLARANEKLHSALNLIPTHDLLLVLMRKKTILRLYSASWINNRIKLIFNLFSQSFILRLVPHTSLIRFLCALSVEKHVIYVI